MNMDELLPLLAESSKDLRSTALRALGDGMGWLRHANDHRWRFRAPGTDLAVRKENLEALKMELHNFRTEKQFAIMGSFRSLFDDEGNMLPESNESVVFSSSSLFRCAIFNTSLVTFCLALIKLLDYLIEIEEGTPKPKFQFPTAFAKWLYKAANSRASKGNPVDLGAPDEDGDMVSDEDQARSGPAITEEKTTRYRTCSYLYVGPRS